MRLTRETSFSGIRAVSRYQTMYADTEQNLCAEKHIDYQLPFPTFFLLPYSQQECFFLKPLVGLPLELNMMRVFLKFAVTTEKFPH